MYKKIKQPIVGFKFQDISLAEAQSVAVAGRGNYSAIIEELLRRIPELAQDQSLAFGLPNGDEPEESHRRGVCGAINHIFKKNSIPWRLTYSGTRKLFVLIPEKISSAKKKEFPGYVPMLRNNKIDAAPIVALKKKGVTVGEISKQLGIPLSSVEYICYQKYRDEIRKAKEGKK